MNQKTKKQILTLILPWVLLSSLSACGGEHVHSYGDWVIVAEASCTENGRRERVCACGETEAEAITTRGHLYRADTHACSVCGKSFFDELVIVQGADSVGFSENPDGESYTLIHVGSYTAAPVIPPESIRGLPITAIGPTCFAPGNAPFSVILPDSVLTLENHAFYYCYGLTSVTMGKAVTTIGRHAFDHCRDLEIVCLPATLTTIEYGAFRGCTALTRIDYEGTRAQWMAVEKAEGWDAECGAYTIRCSDGDFTP